MGDAKEKERGLGPSIDDDDDDIIELGTVVGPSFDDEEDGGASEVRLRYHGLRESKWWDTVKEKRDEAHAPILVAEDGSNRKEAARG